MQAGDKGAVGWFAEDARELIANLVGRERGELDALHLPASPQLGEEGKEWVALIQLVGAIGPDQHHAVLAKIADQEQEHVPGGSIGPVQVLQRDHGGRVRRHALDQAQHLEVEGGLARRGGRLGRVLARIAGREVGDQLQDGGPCRPDDAAEVRRRQGLQPRTKRSDERVVGARPISEVDARTGEEAQHRRTRPSLGAPPAAATCRRRPRHRR